MRFLDACGQPVGLATAVAWLLSLPARLFYLCLPSSRTRGEQHLNAIVLAGTAIEHNAGKVKVPALLYSHFTIESFAEEFLNVLR